MHHPIVFVFIGPQGSGKGTQTAILVQKYGFVVIEMGALLRAEAAKATPLSKSIAEILNKGELVPVAITIQLIRQKLAQIPKDANIIFDGFPRSIEQALELAKLVEVTYAIHIDLPYDVSLKRIAGRLLCPNGHYYNRYSLPPKRSGICDIDQLPLEHREDDTEEAVKRRLDLYEEETKKVLDYYAAQGKSIAINGNTSIEAVAHEIDTKLAPLL